MIKAYADGELFYDSLSPSTRLLSFTATPSVAVAGTAELTMPPGHPSFDRFVSYRTLIEIYRRGSLIFRGRALFPYDDNVGRRNVTFEGERCFFRDSVMRPYLFQDSPEAILAEIVNQHNTQVEHFKTFQVGTVTVTDANDYVRLESESAEQTSTTLDKLLQRCGGYFVFTTDSDGIRRINWLEKLEYKSSQSIEFGENLLDYSRAGVDTGLATRIIPYGAKDETTGLRLTIEGVNNGLDYVEDAEAVALRGVIALPVIWDDVTLAENLLAKAKKYLASSKMMVSTLSLSAVDLSALDADIDTFRVGDWVRVISRPHGVDEDFLLRDRTYDLLNPANDTVTLGKELTTLTGESAASYRDAQSQLQEVEHSIRSDYKLGIEHAMESTRQTLSTLIEQTSTAIRMEVSETYATNENVDSKISTTFTQLADSFNFEFEALQRKVDENDAENREEFETIRKYIRFVEGDIVLGEEGNELTLRIENDRIGFLDGGAEVAYFSNKKLYVLDGHFLNSLRVGRIAIVPRENGNTSIIKVGE